MATTAMLQDEAGRSDIDMLSKIPGTKHKVIGLVSGGKDSCFNLMHCIANGHEIVALATLTPEPGVDELDSHLYQSVGTHLLPLIAKAMNLPLYTGIIKGKAVERGPEYGSRLRGGSGSGEVGDETEDLTILLERVLSEHPEATALSSGAILSTYQRLRIEHVCQRLNLTSLGYLWQSDQMPLLDSMLSCGVEPVLMKVAGVGLGVDMVGKQLGQVRGKLARLEALYGSHPAGEGGEYETLTLDTPLFSHRLKLDKTKVIITDPEPYPVAYLRVEQASLEEKEGWVKPTIYQLRDMLGLTEEKEREGEVLDEESMELWQDLRNQGQDQEQSLDSSFDRLNVRKFESGNVKTEQTDSSFALEESVVVGFAKKGRWFIASVEGRTLPDQNVGDELRECFDAISAKLGAHSLSLPLHATHITLLLSSMSLFLPANEVYKTYFGTSPPSRATVAVPLESGRVRVEVVGFDDGAAKSSGSAREKRIGGRQALHVQSLSYWAPANIGPYSQAIIVNSRIHIAGQIPLIPASLTLPSYPTLSSESPYIHQSVLALQHVKKIIDVLKSKNSTGGGWQGWIESVVAWWALPLPSVKLDRQEGERWVREAWNLWADRNDAIDVPAIFVQARELPKGSLVEYQVNHHTGRRDFSLHSDSDTTESNVDDEEDEDDEELQCVYSSSSSSSSSKGVWWETSQTIPDRGSGSGSGRGFRAVIFISDIDSIVIADEEIQKILRRSVTSRVYHSIPRHRAIDLLEKLRIQVYTFIPVLSISDRSGQRAGIALEIFGI